MAQPDNVMMEGVQIRFRNFKGEVDAFNQRGERNFVVLIDDNLANDMLEDDWNVKWLEPRPEEEGEGRQAFLPVALRYDVFPPRIVVLTESNPEGKVLKEEEVIELDYANFLNVDLIVRPYPWEIKATGKHGIKAYVKTMYITIEEDPLDAKYARMRNQQ